MTVTLESRPLRDHLESVTGFSVPEDRWRSIAPRLLQRVARRGFRDTRAYLSHLTEGPFGRHELEELLEIFTVRKTSFFRNRATFEALSRDVLPPLLGNRSRGAPPPAIWSAGCATGEEPYSIAMAARALAPAEPRPCYILATDIVEAALQRARRGIYNEEVAAEIPERYRHLIDVSDGRAEVAEAVRAAVEFFPHNLVRDPYPRPAGGAWDVIFCRNVIIYFGAEVCRRVLEKLWSVLAPGGALFLGHSEVLWGLDDRFDVVFGDETFFYRKRKAPRSGTTPPPRARPTPRPSPADATDESTPVPPSPTNGRTALDTPGPLPRKTFDGTSSSSDIFPALSSSGPFIEKTPSRVVPVLPYDLLSLAQTELAGGDQEGAARTLRLAIARSPSWAPARLLLGRLYADRGENERAAEELEVALKLTPLDARAHLLLGMVRERRGSREGAEDAYRHAVYLEPDLAAARYALAQIYRATNRIDRARRELRNVIRSLKGKDAALAAKLTDGVSPTALVELCERELSELGG